MTAGSYRVETHFRSGDVSGNVYKQPLILYPLASLLSGFFVFSLSKFFSGRLFLGNPQTDVQNFSVVRSIPGTSVTTYHCFLEPDAPIAASEKDEKCLAKSGKDLPTLFLEGDSIAHALVPLLGEMFSARLYNASFFGRGGCVFPFVEPWPGNRHRAQRYQNCLPHGKIREHALLSRVRPGDYVLIATANSYVQSPESQTRYLKEVGRLAQRLEAKQAGLILFSPLPTFPDRAPINKPLSLCFAEWYVSKWTLVSGCQPATRSREELWRSSASMRDLQARLKGEHTNIKVFDPFPLLCPPGRQQCSTHANEMMYFLDGIHLTSVGARSLYPAFRSFLQALHTRPRYGLEGAIGQEHQHGSRPKQGPIGWMER